MKRQGVIARMTNKKVVNGVTCHSSSSQISNHKYILFPWNGKYWRWMMKEITLGRTAKGDESPTRPPVNEASGIWMSKPSLLRRNARVLSSII